MKARTGLSCFVQLSCLNSRPRYRGWDWDVGGSASEKSQKSCFILCASGISGRNACGSVDVYFMVYGRAPKFSSITHHHQFAFWF